MASRPISTLAQVDRFISDPVLLSNDEANAKDRVQELGLAEQFDVMVDVLAVDHNLAIYVPMMKVEGRRKAGPASRFLLFCPGLSLAPNSLESFVRACRRDPDPRQSP